MRKKKELVERILKNGDLLKDLVVIYEEETKPIEEDKEFYIKDGKFYYKYKGKEFKVKNTNEIPDIVIDMFFVELIRRFVFLYKESSDIKTNKEICVLLGLDF
jgi:hypothetical protein